MDSNIFREKSINRVSSPEQLNDYIRATKPGLWMLLAAIIILLAGLCVWGVFGRLDTTLRTVGVCENGRLTCCIKEENIAMVQTGMKVTINGQEFTLDSISQTPAEVNGQWDAYVLHIGGLSEGEWVFAAGAPANSLPAGVYEAVVTIDSVAPMSFVLN